jgi:hypothetical protein
MADDPKAPEAFTLKRWSQRKLAAAQAASAEPPPPVVQPPAAAPAMTTTETPPASIPEPAPLPPVESLTFDSDFSPFMQPKIDEATKRAALRKLFSDPSFNVMDGLDIYVGDYTQPDPMPAGMLERLSAVYAMLDPVEPPAEEEGAQAAAGGAPSEIVPIAVAPAEDAMAPDSISAEGVGEPVPEPKDERLG